MEALNMVKQSRRENKHLKFSSECLEILLKRNYIETAENLLETYYQGTNIDTDIIVKSVAQEVQHLQDYAVFQIRQKMLPEGQDFPTISAIVYYAQSEDSLHIKVRLSQNPLELDSPICK